MLALPQEANPELTEDTKALTAKGPDHQKPSSSARAAGLHASNGPSGTRKLFCRSFCACSNPKAMPRRPESEATALETQKPPGEHQPPGKCA